MLGFLSDGPKAAELLVGKLLKVNLLSFYLANYDTGFVTV